MVWRQISQNTETLAIAHIVFCQHSKVPQQFHLLPCCIKCMLRCNYTIPLWEMNYTPMPLPWILPGMTGVKAATSLLKVICHSSPPAWPSSLPQSHLCGGNIWDNLSSQLVSICYQQGLKEPFCLDVHVCLEDKCNHWDWLPNKLLSRICCLFLQKSDVLMN